MKKNKLVNIDKINEKDNKDTEYGEYICTYFDWIPLSKQKERAIELNKMTKNEENNKKNEKK